jgi:low temperature requirement protein LtrA
MSHKKRARSVLINPVIARSKDEPYRSATPLELFYDLVYVVAIAFLAGELHHAITEVHHVPHAILMYLWVFWCVWWPWNTYTFFASGYDTDDTQFRLASFAQMIGVIIVAIGVKPAFQEENFLYIMLGYLVMRVPYILMWFKVARDDIESRPVALRYAFGVLLVQCGWTLTVLFYQSWTVWIILLICELLVPWIAERSMAKGENTKYHVEHIEERMGLLTIIVLGESILASVNAFDSVLKNFTPELGMIVSGALLILFSMWWLYFDDHVEEELHDETTCFIWSYGHYFLFAAAAAVGALISVCVDAATQQGNITLDKAVIGLSFALAVYLVATWLCHDWILKKKGLKSFELLILAVIVITLAVMTKSVLLIGFAFVALNAIRVWRKHQGFSQLLSKTQ